MKVVYAKTMLDQLHQIRMDALKEQREIEKVVVTLTEARCLWNEVYSPYYTCSTNDFERWLLENKCGLKCAGPQPKVKVLGIDIEVELK